MRIAAVIAALVASQAAPPDSGRVRVNPVDPVAAGTRGELSLTIEETPHPDAPIELWLESDDVRMPENRLGREDIVDPMALRPRLRAVFYAPAKPGAYEVRGFVMYVVCERKRCYPRFADVIWAIRVPE